MHKEENPIVNLSLQKNENLESSSNEINELNKEEILTENTDSPYEPFINSGLVDSQKQGIDALSNEEKILLAKARNSYGTNFLLCPESPTTEKIKERIDGAVIHGNSFTTQDIEAMKQECEELDFFKVPAKGIEDDMLRCKEELLNLIEVKGLTLPSIEIVVNECVTRKYLEEKKLRSENIESIEERNNAFLKEVELINESNSNQVSSTKGNKILIKRTDGGNEEI